MTYKEILSIAANMEQTTFNITRVSAIGSLCGTYRPAVCPVGILSYLCRDVAFCCMNVSNYMKKISVLWEKYPVWWREVPNKKGSAILHCSNHLILCCLFYEVY
jgi:hypothetical protein